MVYFAVVRDRDNKVLSVANCHLRTGQVSSVSPFSVSHLRGHSTPYCPWFRLPGLFRIPFKHSCCPV